ncbi:MAG: hypothetical protein AAB931_00070 [Patescibacteria group bacterium]
MFHNKVIDYSSLFLENYFKHYSFDFLFTDKGFPDRYRVPSNGLLNLIELPFILLGVWFLLRNYRRIGLFLVGWVLIAPIGSSLTFDDVPNLQRSMLVFPSISIISAYGFINSYLFLKRYKYSLIFTTVIVLTFIYSILFYLHQYYVHQLVHRPWYRQEGYVELIQKVNNLLPDYKKTVITNRESAPTIFFLFYSKYDPLKFQKEKEGKFLGESDSVSFYKYEFSDEECPLRIDDKTKNLTGEDGILYINSSHCNKDIPKTNLIDTIKRNDGSEVFRILEVKR